MKLPDLPDLTRLRDRVIRRATTASYRVPLAMPVESIDGGHIYTTADETRAVYLLGEAGWSNQTAGTQAHVHAMATAAYAALPGRHVKLRVADRPTDSWGWSWAHVHTATNPASLWADHVPRGALRQDMIGLTDTVVVADVHLCRFRKGEPGDWATADAEVRSHLGGEGLQATPAPPGLVEWLIHVSMAPGHNAPPVIPGPRGPDDMGEFTGEVEWECPLGGRMVTVRAWRDNEDSIVERTTYAAVLTVGAMSPRVVPGVTPPWISAALHAGFPVQVAVSGEVIPAGDAAATFRARADWQADNIAHLAEHHLPVPESVRESYADATQLADDLSTGDPAENACVQFVGRFVVTGDTPRETMDRVRALKILYRDRVRVQLVLAADQVTGLSELCPGVRQVSHGYQRYGPVSLLADGMPNVTGKVGQNSGMYLGYTSGDLPGRRVLFDPWYPMETLDQIAIYPVLGDPGAGRSTLGLRVIYEAALAGHHVVALDPAAEWSGLGCLPGLAGRVAEVDLASDAAVAGMLSPTSLVPDPPRDECASDDEWERELEVARSTRIGLMVDAARSIVDDDTWRQETRREAIKDACRDAVGDPWHMVDLLRERGHVRLADEFTTAGKGLARLLFPPRKPQLIQELGSDLLGSQVVVITLHGMEFPAPGTDHEHWTSEERVGAVMLRLAAFLVRRLIKTRPRRERKLLVIDEAHWLGTWEYGRAFVAGFVRNIRRWNLALFLLTQHPGDLARLDPQGESFASGGFVGYTKREDVAEASLAITGAAPGLSPVVKRLSWISKEDRLAGEFLWTDVSGRTERIRVDRDWLPELADFANTTPGAPRSVDLAKSAHAS